MQEPLLSRPSESKQGKEADHSSGNTLEGPGPRRSSDLDSQLQGIEEGHQEEELEDRERGVDTIGCLQGSQKPNALQPEDGAKHNAYQDHGDCESVRGEVVPQGVPPHPHAIRRRNGQKKLQDNDTVDDVRQTLQSHQMLCSTPFNAEFVFIHIVCLQSWL